MHILISKNAYRFYKQQFCSMYSSCFANFSFSKTSTKIWHSIEQGLQKFSFKTKSMFV